MPDPRGAAFPFRIDEQTGGIAMTEGPEKIRDDLRVLLGTRLGERPMLRDFGTRIHALAHEPDDDVTADLLRKQAHEAVVRWERRVVVTRARVDRAREGELHLVLDYVHSDRPVAAQMIIPLV
ncbi:GPW/gp25 family protein [Streptomyces melanogenes]|uniref:GPW/gp25 family protein n=1 Tax=Streptomyces melanogenes TaxID=67326 RepID=UPI0037AD9B96